MLTPSSDSGYATILKLRRAHGQRRATNNGTACAASRAHAAPHVLQLRRRADGRGAALQHVGHLRPRGHRGAEGAHVLLGAQRIDKHSVGALRTRPQRTNPPQAPACGASIVPGMHASNAFCAAHRVGKGGGAPQRFVKADGRARVGARHHHNVRARVARVASGAHARHRLGARYHLAAWVARVRRRRRRSSKQHSRLASAHMATLLRRHLVLDQDASEARLRIAAHLRGTGVRKQSRQTQQRGQRGYRALAVHGVAVAATPYARPR